MLVTLQPTRMVFERVWCKLQCGHRVTGYLIDITQGKTLLKRICIGE